MGVPRKRAGPGNMSGSQTHGSGRSHQGTCARLRRMEEQPMASEQAPASNEARKLTSRAKNEAPLLSGLHEESFEIRSTAVVVIDMVNHQLSRECAISMYEDLGLS